MDNSCTKSNEVIELNVNSNRYDGLIGINAMKPQTKKRNQKSKEKNRLNIILHMNKKEKNQDTTQEK